RCGSTSCYGGGRRRGRRCGYCRGCRCGGRCAAAAARAVRVASRHDAGRTVADVAVACLTVCQVHLLDAASGEDVEAAAWGVRVTVVQVNEEGRLARLARADVDDNGTDDASSGSAVRGVVWCGRLWRCVWRDRKSLFAQIAGRDEGRVGDGKVTRAGLSAVVEGDGINRQIKEPDVGEGVAVLERRI